MTPADLAATMRAIREPGNPADVSRSVSEAASARRRQVKKRSVLLHMSILNLVATPQWQRS